MLETIEFQGSTLYVATDRAGERWVAMKPICEALGIQTQRQQNKIQQDPKFSCTHMYATGTDGKNYEMLCIPIQQLNGWLFSINANKVAPAVRDNLLIYQQQCFDVLFRHFMPQGGTNQDLMDVFKSFRSEMREELGRFHGEMTQRLDHSHEEVNQRFDYLQGEVDELRELIHITLSDKDEKEIRELLRKVKEQTNLDGRAIVGHVRGLLGTSGIYNTPHLPQVKNILHNMLGKGIFGAIKE
jgi:hypothetical protein